MLEAGFQPTRPAPGVPFPDDQEWLSFGPSQPVQSGFLYQFKGNLEDEMPMEEIEEEIKRMKGKFKDSPGASQLLKILEESDALASLQV